MYEFVDGRWIRCCSVLFLIAAMVGCSKERPQSSGPVLPVYEGPPVSDFAVWRPYFTVGDQAIDPDRVVSTAFALSRDEDSPPILLTSLHTAIGADAPIEDSSVAAEFGGAFRDIMISEAFGAGDELRQAGFGLSTVRAEDTEVQDAASMAHDVLIFEAGASKRRLRPLSLKVEDLSVGKSVWMATAVYGGASPSTVAHEAILTECRDDGTWAYKFTNEDLSLQATSGAPLLNLEGNVVGIHLSSDPSIEAVNGIGVSGKVLQELLQTTAQNSPEEDSPTAEDP